MGENLLMVYGITGELVTEYEGTTGTLQKEYVYGASGLVASIEVGVGTHYVTADHLGSPRIETSSTGAVISRHDYQPFGEELYAGVGGRTTVQGYSNPTDSLRQKFTGKERDDETGLDYFLARYYSSAQGRFTSPDPIMISDKQTLSPQLWNLYNYVGNNPLGSTDPTGMEVIRLGQHSDEYIKERQQEIARQLKDPNANLTSRQRQSLGNESRRLGLEMEGNAVVRQEIQRLNDIGEGRGLRASDFSLSTEPQKDFMADLTKLGGVNKAREISNHIAKGAMFVIEGLSTQIYINTTNFMYAGALGKNPDYEADDFLTYGATAMAHERIHRDGRSAEQRSEHAAYTEQLRVLNKFGGAAFKSTFFWAHMYPQVVVGTLRKD